MSDINKQYIPLNLKMDIAFLRNVLRARNFATRHAVINKILMLKTN